MRKRAVQSVFAVLVLLSLAGCDNPGGGRAPGQSVQSDVPRVTSPTLPAGDLAKLVGGNNAFALDLYRQLRGQQDGNLFFSPYSISLALAMTYAGAQSETAQEMAEALHFTLPPDRLHPAFNTLDLELARRGEGAEGRDGEGFRLNVANALWGQEGYAFLPEFLDTLAANYGAGLNLLDFADDAEASRAAINDWVSRRTEGRIEDLLAPGTVDELTRLVLTNAIYFNAAWDEPFEERRTQDGPFYRLDGSQVLVPLMRQSERLAYGEGEDYQVVELPYDGRELAMVILLPQAGAFETFEDTLDAGRLEAILQRMDGRQVELTMPRFELTSDFSLADTLSAVGMPTAFTDAADFSGMTGGRDLLIADVIHKAFVSVDEEGTEAAAATAVVMAPTSAEPEEPAVVTVDRPFVFLIRDLQTGAILFAGRVVDPS